jgi:2-polyprenyl-3-methyl-5-hydroxy-6-metoxy-1,4-benzoquinol methylase
MMTSFVENIPVIINLAVALNPLKILDVGSGFGKYGLLLREALLSNQAERKNQIIPDKYFQIDCVENCEYFTSQYYHTLLYDKHYHCDLFEIPLNPFFDYDLILLIDVVEHHPKAKMLDWIRKVRGHCQGVRILVSTPKKVVFYDIEYYGKDCPKHVSQWNWLDFKEFNASLVDTKNSYIAIIR